MNSDDIFIGIMKSFIDNSRKSNFDFPRLDRANSYLQNCGGYKKNNPELVREFTLYYNQAISCKDRLDKCSNVDCNYYLGNSCDLLGQFAGFMHRRFDKLPLNFPTQEEVILSKTTMSPERLVYFFANEEYKALDEKGIFSQTGLEEKLK